MPPSSVLKLASVFIACVLLAAGAAWLFLKPSPETADSAPPPEHPHLAVVPRDVGRVEYPGDLSDYQMIGLYQFTIFLPRTGIARIEPLGECPVRTLRIHGAGRKFRVEVSPNESLTYAEARETLYALPGGHPSLLRRKFAVVLPYAHGNLTLREFSIEGMKGFQVGADRPIAGQGFVTTYYLFPEEEGVPSLRVEIVERAEGEIPRGIPDGIHAVIAGSSYPGITGDPLDRLRAAQHARQHEALRFSLFEAISLVCSPYANHALYLAGFAALELYQFDTAREAVHALYRLGGDTSAAQRLLESIHDTETLYHKARAEGAPPPPVQWKAVEIE